MKHLTRYGDVGKSFFDKNKKPFIGQTRKEGQAKGVFGAHGNKLSAQEFERYTKKAPHIRSQHVDNLREMVTQSKDSDKLDMSKQVTPEEFSQKLEDLTNDRHYPLSTRELSSLKRYFLG